MRGVIHTITPGDHFSPRTGSAIPTVVHGMAGAASTLGDVRHKVIIDSSTFRPRYSSADVIEYTGNRQPSRMERRLDAVRGWLGGTRPAIATYYHPIAAVLREQPPATVLAHNAPVLVRLLRDSHHRVVLYAHNELLRTYSRAEAGRMLDGAAAIVCVSDSLAESTRRRLPGHLADRVLVVHNGTDTAQFTPTPAHSAGSADRRIHVLFVGRVIPEKGVDVLVRAAALVRNRDVEFTIVGSAGFARDASLSDYEQELRRIAADGSAQVTFEPFIDRDELPRLLASADVFVVPSRWPDPCPLTVGEALASGLPVIASRIGGIPEIVAPSSVLVPPGDPGVLANEIEALAGNRQLRDQMAADGRSWAESHDWAWAWQSLRSVLADL